MARRLGRLAIVALCLAAVSCGELPQPFRPEVKTASRLLVPPNAVLFEVAQIEPLPPLPEAMLRAALAEALRDRDVAATAVTNDPRNPRLVGTVAEGARGDKSVKIAWQVVESGQATGLAYTQEAAVSAGALADGDQAAIADVADSAAGHLASLLTGGDPAVAMAPIPRPDDPQYASKAPPQAQPAAASTEAAATAAVAEAHPAATDIATPAKPKPRPAPPPAKAAVRVAILEIPDAPGDAATSLPKALASHLRSVGVPIIPAAEAGAKDLRVRGTVNLKPAAKDRQQVDLVWRLEDNNGKEIGQVSQSNTVTAGSLDGAWGPVAVLASLGAAEGLVVLLRKTGALPKPGGSETGG